MRKLRLGEGRGLVRGSARTRTHVSPPQSKLCLAFPTASCSWHSSLGLEGGRCHGGERRHWKNQPHRCSYTNSPFPTTQLVMAPHENRPDKTLGAHSLYTESHTPTNRMDPVASTSATATSAYICHVLFCLKSSPENDMFIDF